MKQETIKTLKEEFKTNQQTIEAKHTNKTQRQVLIRRNQLILNTLKELTETEENKTKELNVKKIYRLKKKYKYILDSILLILGISMIIALFITLLIYQARDNEKMVNNCMSNGFSEYSCMRDLELTK